MAELRETTFCHPLFHKTSTKLEATHGSKIMGILQS